MAFVAPAPMTQPRIKGPISFVTFAQKAPVAAWANALTGQFVVERYVGRGGNAGSATTVKGPLRALALSADGQFLAVAEGANLVTVWDVSNPTKPRKLFSPTTAAAPAVFLTFLPGSNLLAVATQAKTYTLALFDLKTQKETGSVTSSFPEKLTALTGSSDGKHLVVANDNTDVTSIDVSDKGVPTIGTLFGLPDMMPYTSLTLVNSVLIAGNSNGTARIVFFNADLSKITVPLVTLKPAAGGGDVAVAFDATGKIAVTADKNGNVESWNLAGKFQKKLQKPLTGPITSLAISFDNKNLLGGVAPSAKQGGTTGLQKTDDLELEQKK